MSEAAQINAPGEAIEFHPLANEFPLLQGKEMEELTKSIKKNGLLEPIVLHEGKILDGRNRYRACEAAEVAAIFDDYTGDDPLGFVIAKNLDRRHLTTGQRAMIAARLAAMSQGGDRQSEDFKSRNRPLTQKEAADALNVGVTALKEAKAVFDKGTPDEISAVQDGTAPLHTVAEKIRAREPDEAKKGGTRIIVPEGETVESAVRAGILSGGTIGTAARELGMGAATYAKISDILRLLDMSLSDEDRAACRSVMDEINAERRMAPYERLRPLIKRVWGDEKHYSGAETKRLEAFRRAVNVVIMGASALPEIEIPYLESTEREELIEELKAAEVQVRSFHKTLRGIG
jgi:hypothetical protein